MTPFSRTAAAIAIAGFLLPAPSLAAKGKPL